MNFAKYENSNILYTDFNQTKDCIIFGTVTGFYVYTLEPFKKIIARKIPGGVSIVQMLYRSNIIIFTGNTNTGLYPNTKLIIWDDNCRGVIGEIEFKFQILNLKITKNIIIVVTKVKIYIYNFQNLELIRSIETVDNINGICSITLNNDCLIAYPGSSIGEIHITKQNNDYLKIIKAHLSKIQLFNISNNGKYIVTCSEKGTLLRIYEIETGILYKEFRRGSDQTIIIDLKFSDDMKYLLCSSIKGTIHLFYTNINESNSNESNSNESNSNESNISIGYGLNMITDYLPKYFNSRWSFSQLYFDNIKTWSLINSDKETIISIGHNGCYYSSKFNIEKSELINSYKFISDENDPFNNRTSTIK